MHYKHIMERKNTFIIATILSSTLLSSASYAQTEITHGTSPFNRAVIFGDSLSDNGFFLTGLQNLKKWTPQTDISAMALCGMNIFSPIKNEGLNFLFLVRAEAVITGQTLKTGI